MDVKELIGNHLAQKNVIQLATIDGDKPWLCTVHFYADEKLNVYWVSRSDRNHSQHIDKNPNVSITAVVHENTPDENYVISVTATGTAEVVDDPAALAAYKQKFPDKPPALLPNPSDPGDLQVLYRFTPKQFVLFDTKNFSQSPRQEINLED